MEATLEGAPPKTFGFQVSLDFQSQWRSARGDIGEALQMAVKVDDSDGAIGLVHAAQQRQSDGVVTTHGNDTRKGLSLLRWAKLLAIVCGLAHEDGVVTLFNLLDSPLVVIATLGQSGVLVLPSLLVA